MTFLLVGDTHFDSAPANEYRWAIFNTIREQIKWQGVRRIIFMGDVCDRTDRHPGVLVNRLIEALTSLHKETSGIELSIIMGNHDITVKQEAFWKFLNSIRPPVTFYTQPTRVDDRYFLPFTNDPATAWAGLDWSGVKAAFIHQPVTGARTSAHHVIENKPLPVFPRGVLVYAGDIHVAQTVGGITYVGSPHPIDFGDDYKCRLLLLGNDYRIAKEITLSSVRKSVVTISELDQLDSMGLKQGDQVRIKYDIKQGSLSEWHVMDVAIDEWAKQNGIVVASTEVRIMDTKSKTALAAVDASPETVLAMFAEANDLSQEVVDVGIALLKQVLGSHKDR